MNKMDSGRGSDSRDGSMTQCSFFYFCSFLSFLSLSLFHFFIISLCNVAPFMPHSRCTPPPLAIMRVSNWATWACALTAMPWRSSATSAPGWQRSSPTASGAALQQRQHARPAQTSASALHLRAPVCRPADIHTRADAQRAAMTSPEKQQEGDAPHLRIRAQATNEWRFVPILHLPALPL
ncbi:MAG: hypothetical protein RMK84_20010 [Oscillochloridaceae bacterium]|nr:hypothetical protein [Oscillochloridaceae bacterium]